MVVIQWLKASKFHCRQIYLLYATAILACAAVNRNVAALLQNVRASASVSLTLQLPVTSALSKQARRGYQSHHSSPYRLKSVKHTSKGPALWHTSKTAAYDHGILHGHWFKSHLPHFQSRSLLTAEEKHQKTTQLPGLLPLT